MIRPHFSQLSESDRWVMDSMLAEGHSQASVARSIGVHPSTICRERKRGLLPGCDRYFAVVGERRRVAARARSGLSRRKLGTDRNSPYWQLVLPYLHQGWSPEQIAGRLKLMPESPCVSHETI